jgi:transposase
MISFREDLSVQVNLSPVDFRLGLNGLLALIESVFGKSPQGNYLFLFRDRTRKKIKVVYWDQNGFVLMYKRLEVGHFQFPKIFNGEMQLNRLQFECLLSGINFITQTPVEPREYCVFR